MRHKVKCKPQTAFFTLPQLRLGRNHLTHRVVCAKMTALRSKREICDTSHWRKKQTPLDPIRSDCDTHQWGKSDVVDLTLVSIAYSNQFAEKIGRFFIL